jgi:CPA2 family monovalent cation:H+ antiporter-2
MQIPLLNDFVILFGLSIAVIFACTRLRIPAIVGFLLTGIIAGPSGLGLIDNVHEVEIMAEVGVILLLFTIGLELSLKELMALKKPVFVGGGLQVLATIVIVDVIAFAVGLRGGTVIFAGFLAALSSTAIVLKLLQDRAEMESPHGRIALSILIFQDLIIVPMMLLVPFLTGETAALGTTLLWLVLKTAGVLLLLYLLSRFVVHKLLMAVLRTRSRELFILALLAICLSVAWLTSWVGLSLSLGAFLAGLIVSETEYGLSALEGVLPFRDVFTSLFFISVGMLLDAGYLAANLPLVALFTVLILIGKTIIASAAAKALGFPLRTALLAGLALSQVGEFSFILAKAGLDHGLLPTEHYQLFLAVSIMTMVTCPFVMMASPHIADAAGRLPGLHRLAVRTQHEVAPPKLNDHLVIIGYGIGGRHLARAAESADIAYTVLEMNPDTVRNERAQGVPIAYGDASHAEVLRHAGIERARILAIVVSDPSAIRRIVDMAREINPSLHIIARTRFTNEVEPLCHLGADDVVSEEFETSIEMFTRVLTAYLVPQQRIEDFTKSIRDEGYAMLRACDLENAPLKRIDAVITGHEVANLEIESGSRLDGMELLSSGLRRDHGLTVVAVQRDDEVIANPPANFTLRAGDAAYLFGTHDQIGQAAWLFREPEQEVD